jgi:hypothetical protein
LLVFAERRGNVVKNYGRWLAEFQAQMISWYLELLKKHYLTIFFYIVSVWSRKNFVVISRGAMNTIEWITFKVATPWRRLFPNCSTCWKYLPLRHKRKGDIDVQVSLNLFILLVWLKATVCVGKPRRPPPFYSPRSLIDFYLDLLVFRKGLRTPNLLRFIPHVMLVLLSKYGVPSCLRSLVLSKRSFGSNLAKSWKKSERR